MNPPEMMTVAEVADALKVSTSTVYRLIDTGTLRPIVLGPRTIRLRRAEVFGFLHTGPTAA